jgi:hypothetical protein
VLNSVVHTCALWARDGQRPTNDFGLTSRRSIIILVLLPGSRRHGAFIFWFLHEPTKIMVPQCFNWPETYLDDNKLGSVDF